MASRSRHLTRNDPEGRFSPLTTAERNAAAAAFDARMKAVMKPNPPSNVKPLPIFSAREALPWLGLMGVGGL